MTANRFMILCLEFGIDPAVALENPAVQIALKARDDNAVRHALETEF